MPYVDQETRDDLASDAPVDGGELNYLLTRQIIEFIHQVGLSYKSIEAVRAACVGAMSEFDRRVAWPYEDQAILRNGDVYPSTLPTEKGLAEFPVRQPTS